MTAALGLLFAYLAGSFPTAWLVGRARGLDLGAVGSGNYGATNVFRNLGWGPALVVVAVDVAKGFVPVEFFPGWLPAGVLPEVAYQVLLAVAAVLGHVFSVFLSFRGGKGVGTAAGAFLALAPVALLAAALAWVLVVTWRRIVSLASLAGTLVLLVAVWVEHGRESEAWPLLLVTTFLAGFVFWTHRENIGRLRRGEERRITAGHAKRRGA
ncbi:MAG TPA: glycerol-3-phosphate 1-O-acyltransferase PlsY [Gemmatimonadota bacterium]|nr:glycerol-3-phosphate 1-O-acyltransferase PlsY [Gemmatimonadota bacterium]